MPVRVNVVEDLVSSSPDCRRRAAQGNYSRHCKALRVFGREQLRSQSRRRVRVHLQYVCARILCAMRDAHLAAAVPPQKFYHVYI